MYVYTHTHASTCYTRAMPMRYSTLCALNSSLVCILSALSYDMSMHVCIIIVYIYIYTHMYWYYCI